MMQETGNNTGGCENRILSIQLSLSGLYFSVSCEGKVSSLTHLPYYKQLSEPANVANALNSDAQLVGEYSRVNVVLDTVDSVLVPQNLFSTASAREILATNGIEVADHECVVVSPSVGGIIAVAKYDAMSIDVLSHRFADIRFWTPLLVDTLALTDAMQLTINDTVAHINYVVDGRLLYAESLTYRSEEDLLYFADTVSKKFHAEAKVALQLSGQCCLKYEKFIRKCFPAARVEVFSSLIFDEHCGVDNTLFNTLIKLSRENY